MAVTQQFKTSPETYVPAEAITAGQVVEARAASRVGVGAAGSVKTLGIAVTSGINPEAFVDTPTTPTNGLPTINAAQLPGHVVVANSGIVVGGVKYAAAAAFGDRLKTAAAGTVTPMASTDDPRMLIGICAEPAGVLINATGLVRTL